MQSSISGYWSGCLVIDCELDGPDIISVHINSHVCILLQMSGIGYGVEILFLMAEYYLSCLNLGPGV